MKVFNDLKTRGVNDIPIAVTDGLKGMSEALGAVFPAITLQTCIVHLIRNSQDLRQLEGPQDAGSGHPADLRFCECRSSTGRTRGLRARPLGPEVPHGGGLLAPGLEPSDSVLRIPAADQAGDLHDQRNRKY